MSRILPAAVVLVLLLAPTACSNDADSPDTAVDEAGALPRLKFLPIAEGGPAVAPARATASATEMPPAAPTPRTVRPPMIGAPTGGGAAPSGR